MFKEIIMNRIDYYDRMVKNIAIKGVGSFFIVGSLIAWFFI